jgi:hypothetical protein
MATADLRGFRDPLTPLRQRREWLLERAIGAAAKLRLHLAQAEQDHKLAGQRLQAASSRAVQMWRERTDPSAQVGLLAYLAQLHEAVAAAAREEERLRNKLAEATQLVLARQQQVEMLVCHREDALAEYRVAQTRKVAGQADDDWTARAGFRGQVQI